MPRRYELTWDKRNRRWKKFYKGKQYYFPFGQSKADVEGYNAALDAWHKKKAELDAKSPERLLLDAHQGEWLKHLERMYEGMRRLSQEDTFHNRDLYQKAMAVVESTRQKIADGVAHPTLPPAADQAPNFGGELTPTGPAPWEMQGGAADEVEADETTIGGNVRRFLLRKQQQAERGERSHGRYDSLRVCLEDFADFAGGSRPIADINGSLLLRYRDYLERRIASEVKGKKQISRHHAHNHIQAAKQFVKWAWEQELLELPRILKGQEFSIVTPEKKVEVFTPEELKLVLETAGPSVRLYLLLCLNCGMYQGDVAELRHTEVDWKAKTITRKRSKTRGHKDVPEVKYFLWPETWALLQEFKSGHPELALTNRKGEPLKTEIIVNRKVKKTDNIRSAYNRVLRKIAENAEKEDDGLVIDKPIKVLRKTAATALGEHKEFGRFAQYYLGHSPRTVADKHYIVPSEAQFRKALLWLRGKLGIDKVGVDATADAQEG